MLTIKNGQILLYCYFNKIIKGPGTSFQFAVLSQKYIPVYIYLIAYQYLTKLLFESASDSKEIRTKVHSTSGNACDDVTEFEIWISWKNELSDISRMRHYFFFTIKKSLKLFKFTKNQSFTLSLEDIFLENHSEGPSQPF